MLLTRPLTFFGGKGGVGKTTLASAHALRVAADGARTLLVSTDPAHSTADVFGVALGDEPRRVAERLDALEIDPARRARRHIERIKEDARRAVSPEVRDAVERHLDAAVAAPGTEESALFDALVDLMETCPERYDRVVFDTAPTGHTLRLLALPALLQTWVEGVARQRERAAAVDRMAARLGGGDPADDPLLEKLKARRARFARARTRLEGDALFHLVLVPERLAIEETARALALLEQHGITVGGLLVNRVLPDLSEGPFLRARRAQQEAYLYEIERRFRGRAVTVVLQRERDVAGIRDLEEIGRALFADRSPRQNGDRARPAGHRGVGGDGFEPPAPAL